MPASKLCGWLFQTRRLADGSMWVFHGNSVMGSGQSPPLAATELADLYRRLMALYELRLDAHYRALAVPLEQAQQGVQTAFDVIERVRRHTLGEAS